MIRVLVVDDLKLIHEGLQALFVSNDDISITGFAHNKKEAIEQITQDEPDIILMDILKPIIGGIETITEISRRFPNVKVVVLSNSEDYPAALDAIVAGAKGYLLKNMTAQDLTTAINSVYQGSAHFPPRIINSLAKTAVINSNSNKKQTKKLKPKPQKPLFKYGDWLTIIMGVVFLCQINGMGHHLAHTGLFLLMLSLIARPIKKWWNWPLKNRRAIGIIAFAAAVAHSLYATIKILDLDLEMMLAMSVKDKWGIGIGILSLIVMTPAAITSFQFFQKKLGKQWRKIHLLTVPSLGMAVLHTVLAGPHYTATFSMDALDYARTFGVITIGLLVFLMRKQIFWSTIAAKN